MLQRIKNLLERNSLFLAIASSFCILVLSLISMEGVPNLKFNNTDKYEHAFAYTFMSFFWMLSCQLGKIKLSFLHLILIIILYGIIIEVLQMSVTVSRTGDLLDVLANSVGVILGYVILRLLRRLYLQV